MTNQEFIRSLENYARNLKYASYEDVQAALAKFPREDLATRLAGHQTKSMWYGVSHGNHNRQPLLTQHEVATILQIISTIPRGPKLEAPHVDFGLQGEAKKEAEKKRKEVEAQIRKEEAYWPDYFKTPQALGYFLDETSEGAALFHIFDKPVTTKEYCNAIYALWHHGQANRAKRSKDLVGQIAGCATGAGILGLAAFGLKKLVFRG